LELTSRSVTLATLAERFAQLTTLEATLLQVELREQGGLLNRLGLEQTAPATPVCSGSTASPSVP
jgi:hypothetical protein